MSEIQPPAVVDAQVVDVTAENVRTAVEAQLAIEAEMNKPERQLPTLYEYLLSEIKQGKIDHALRASVTEDGHIYFYIHPHGRDGQTADFYLNPEGQVIPVNAPGPLKSEAVVNA